MTAPEPTEIRLRRAERVLEITFADGAHFELSAEYLRVESPSAEVQGHSPSERQLVAGKKAVGISRLEPNGNYAVRITFDDGHSTGIYSWDYLHRLGREQDQRWTAYLKALDAAGLSRDPG
ncbi:gamma-butyrobetaine hydroxylase-like domain-containing protein [Acidiphilium cryptum]|uniref:Gamma-butyrobetaine hydroxylase-like N-terminal domain-containing protein n=1 Tax=Acidiphilium cryptum (strain JF-5) TaxID=349163 RepID=A5G0E3_ACICJ|nr:DUF971 domain-containing protein [Acidiphilium cryptum]ABQ31325.1 protein of unknown function DUF971 [Acidiphilium cryptum JF-5]